MLKSIQYKYKYKFLFNQNLHEIMTDNEQIYDKKIIDLWDID